MGNEEFDDTKLFMKKMDIREENEVTMGELFDQYVWKGRAEGQLSVMKSFMKELHLTVEETLKAAGIPEKEWERYEKQLVN